MLAEFLSKVEDLARRAAQLQIVTHPSEPTALFLVRGDKLEVRHAPPTSRNHALVGLDDVFAVLADPSVATAPEVYHAEREVCVVLDRSSRRELARMPLKLTDRFAQIQALQTPVKFEPRAAVKFLQQRIGAPYVPIDVINGLRRIDFTRTSAGKTHVEHGKESLGRSVEAAVQQADKIPEEFKVRVPVYSNPGLRGFHAEVAIGIYIDLENQVLELKTGPDEVETAIQQAQARIHEALVNFAAEREPGLLILYGVP